MSREWTPEASLTRIEEEVRRFWRRHGVLEGARAARRDGRPLVIFQQPVSAVGQPRDDYVRLLTTGDLFARYRTMQGDAVFHQAGWGCHGLPVEVAVEKSLGSGNATHDLAHFNSACRNAAIEGVHQDGVLAERLGVWLDPASTYATMAPEAIGAVWGALRRLWDAGRLKRERRVAPVCPRCATPLSMAESTRRAVEVETRSMWVRLPWHGESNAYFLSWVPTPWTLVGMVALAAHPDANYALAELAGEDNVPPTQLLLAETALDRTLTGDFQIVRWIRGKSLRNARYRPPFAFVPVGTGIDRIVLSKDVPLHEGTGLVPVTPAFDALSLALAQTYDLPVPGLLDSWGSLEDPVTRWRGLSPLEAEPLLMEDLEARGLLFREQSQVGHRALCPYCDTPLLSLARYVWLVDTDRGPWILGRDRAWGAPLPVWACAECDQEVCVAGLDDLAHRTGLDADRIDPHRPGVDRLTFPCESCSGTMRRVTAVVDAAFEAAVLPLSIAQLPVPAGAPAVPHGSGSPGAAQADQDERSQGSLAVGLGHGPLSWQDNLAEAASLLPDLPTREKAVSLSESDRAARWDLERSWPSDALRWAAYTEAAPERAERGFLRPLWHLAADLLRAESQTAPSLPRKGQDLLDRWLMARLQQAIGEVTRALDAGEPRLAAGELAGLVSDLSHWQAIYGSKYTSNALGTMSRLLAPFAPHLAEAIHRQVGKVTVDSVHLSDWPAPDPAWIDPPLLAGVARVLRLAQLGQVARSQVGIGSDRTIAQALVHVLSGDSAESELLVPYKDLLVEMLGVVHLQLTSRALRFATWHLTLDPTRAIEREATSAEIDGALASLSPEEAAELASQLRDGLSISVDMGERAVTLLPDEVNIAPQAKPGWAAAADTDFLVVLEVG